MRITELKNNIEGIKRELEKLYDANIDRNNLEYYKLFEINRKTFRIAPIRECIDNMGFLEMIDLFGDDIYGIGKDKVILSVIDYNGGFRYILFDIDRIV